MAVNINVPSQVKTYADLASFPASGALKTIYIAEDTNKTYRWTGSVYVEVSASASGITIGTTAITSGTVGRVLFEGAGNVVQESANLFWDNTNVAFVLGSIATRQLIFRPQATTGAYGNSASISGGAGNGRLDFYSGSNITELRDNIILLTSATGPSLQVGTGYINLNVGGTRLQVAPTTGNVLINTTTDAGFRLDVNGTARVSGDVLLTSGILATSVATTRLQSILNFFSHNRLASSGVFGWDIRVSGNQNSFWTYDGASGNTRFGSNAYGIEFYGNNAIRAFMTAGGNWLINTTTDAGFRLDVNGTARVSETITSNLSSANWDLGTYNILDLQRNGSSRATLKSNGTFSWTSGTDLTINSGGGTARTVLSSVNSEILAVANQAGVDYNARFSQRAGKIALRVLGISGTTQNLFEVLTGASVNIFQIKSDGKINMSALPTSSAGLSTGDIWNDAGTLKIV